MNENTTRYDGTLRVVMWLDAFWSAAATLIAIGGSLLVALLGLPHGAHLAVGISALVAAAFLAACGAVTGVLLMLRMNAGHYTMPPDLRVPLPRGMVPARSAPTRERPPTGATTTAPRSAALLRGWRERRRLSQLELSSRAEVSTRHLSFVETGRSRPTPEMIERLAGHLDVPLRERNRLLLAGGYAPAHPEHALDEPDLAAVRDALRVVLAAHEPHPAVLLNRWWELVDANAAIAPLIEGVAPALLEPRSTCSGSRCTPTGSRPGSATSASGAAHLLEQLHQRIERTADRELVELADELAGYPGGTLRPAASATDVVLPLRLDSPAGELSFFSHRRARRHRHRRHRRGADPRGVLPGRRGHRGRPPQLTPG